MAGKSVDGNASLPVLWKGVNAFASLLAGGPELWEAERGEGDLKDSGGKEERICWMCDDS